MYPDHRKKHMVEKSLEFVKHGYSNENFCIKDQGFIELYFV